MMARKRKGFPLQVFRAAVFLWGFLFVASPAPSPGLIVVPTAKNGPVFGVNSAGKLRFDSAKSTRRAHFGMRKSVCTPENRYTEQQVRLLEQF